MDDDDLLSQFQEITGATAEVATQYLEIADFDIQQAMQLYFENGGASLGPTHQPSSTTPSRPRNRREDTIHVDSDDDEITIDEERSTAPATTHRTETTYEDDAAMARRLQEELYAGGDSAEQVRAPMARTTETLVGPGAEGYGDFDPLSHFRMRPNGRSSESKDPTRPLTKPIY